MFQYVSAERRNVCAAELWAGWLAATNNTTSWGWERRRLDVVIGHRKCISSLLLINDYRSIYREFIKVDMALAISFLLPSSCRTIPCDISETSPVAVEPRTHWPGRSRDPGSSSCWTGPTLTRHNRLPTLLLMKMAALSELEGKLGVSLMSDQ